MAAPVGRCLSAVAVLAGLEPREPDGPLSSKLVSNMDWARMDNSLPGDDPAAALARLRAMAVYCGLGVWDKACQKANGRGAAAFAVQLILIPGILRDWVPCRIDKRD